MAKLYNLARMTTATTGTGTITLGSAVSGYLSFAGAGVVDGDAIFYAIKDGSNSEIGTGTYTASGTTLTRSVINSTNSNAAISLSGSAEVFISPPASAWRERLTASRTYYVRTDGSDSNTGLSNTSGGAFLTIQKAFDTVYGTLDLNGFDVAINVGAGTYTNGIVVSSPQVGNGNISLIGDISTPSNVLISVSSGDCIYVNCATSILVRGLKLANSSSGYGLRSGAPGARLNYGNIEFGRCVNMIRAEFLGVIQNRAIGNITVSDGVDRFISAGQGGIIFMEDHTVTLTGTPAFSQSFAHTASGQIASKNVTYSGSATGLRYSVSANGVINTFGGGASVFPGDVAGATATGGQYL